MNNLVDVETLAQEAFTSILDVQAEKIAQNHNIVSTTLNSIVNIAKNLYDDGPLLSINSTFLNEENAHAIEAVKKLHQANENMISAYQECARLKEVLERKRTGVLANYEQEMRLINEEKEKAIKLAEEQIYNKTNQAKQTMLLSSSTACNLLLDPEHLALNFTRNDFNFITEKNINNAINNSPFKTPMKRECTETSSTTSSGFYEDDEDLYVNTMPRSRSSSRNVSNRLPIKMEAPVRMSRSSKKTLGNRIVSNFPAKIQNEHYGRVIELPNCEPQPSTSENITFDPDIFGSTEVDPLKITCIEKKTPVLSTSLAANFILNNLQTIDKKSKLAETLYEACRYQFMNYELMFSYIAKKFGISPQTYIDVDIINFPVGCTKMNTLINRFNDELMSNQLLTDNKTYNNALVIANIFVHLARYSTNAYYGRFLSDVKVEPQ